MSAFPRSWGLPEGHIRELMRLFDGQVVDGPIITSEAELTGFTFTGKIYFSIC